MTTAEPTDSEDDDLQFVRGLRREVERTLRTSTGKIPDDPRMLTLYLHNLDSIERTALGRKRISADKQIGNQQAANAAVIARLLADPRTSKVGLGHREEIPVLESDIAPSRVLDGELGESNSGDSYEAFAKRVNTQT